MRVFVLHRNPIIIAEKTGSSVFLAIFLSVWLLEYALLALSQRNFPVPVYCWYCAMVEWDINLLMAVKVTRNSIYNNFFSAVPHNYCDENCGCSFLSVRRSFRGVENCFNWITAILEWEIFFASTTSFIQSHKCIFISFTRIGSANLKLLHNLNCGLFQLNLMFTIVIYFLWNCVFKRHVQSTMF